MNSTCRAWRLEIAAAMFAVMVGNRNRSRRTGVGEQPARPASAAGGVTARSYAPAVRHLVPSAWC